MFKESEDILKEALATFMKLCGEESVEVAIVLNDIAVTYMRMEQFQMSRFVLIIVLAACTRTNSPNLCLLQPP